MSNCILFLLFLLSINSIDDQNSILELSSCLSCESLGAAYEGKTGGTWYPLDRPN